MRVFSGHIVPLMLEEGVRTYVSEFTSDDYNKYVELLELLKEKLKIYIREIEAEEGKQLSLEKKVKAIGDFIVAFFKIPLNPPLYPRYEEAIHFPTPQEYYWLWVLSRHITAFRDEIWSKYGNLVELIKVLHDRLGDLAALTGVSGLISEANLDRVFNITIKLPSDTRPGLNTSKLIIHSLATSALAVCKGICRGLSGLDLEILRLASLLHDLGKPGQWFSEDPARTSHARLSGNIAEKLLKDILDPGVVEEIKTLVTYHHECDSISDPKLKMLCRILREADTDSSVIDRVVEVIADTVAKELNIDVDRAITMLKGTGVSVWNFWLSIGDDKVKAVTNVVAKKLSQEPLKIRKLTRADTVRDVKVVFCDMRKIQEFIHVESLRSLAVRSYIVDLATIYAIPRAAIEVFNVNPENIVYAGGGFAIVIIPDVADELVEKFKQKYIDTCGFIEGESIAPKITIASSDLYVDWRFTFEKTIEKLTVEKHVINRVEPSELIGFEKPCEICGRRPAIKDNMCQVCKKLEEVATETYFPRKLKALTETYGYTTLSWNVLKEWIIEWLAGNTIDEKTGGISDEKVFNVSMVKIDGNFMGTFMGDAISVSDAFERSVRIDRALKKGLHRTLHLLKQSINLLKEVSDVEEKILAKMGEHGFTRLYTGVLYVGGDDALILMPAWLTLPASLYIAYWFWRELGGVRQLSIGIASGKPKHNIWGLLEAATYMLNDVCKDSFREELRKIFRVPGDAGKVIEELKKTVAVLGFVYTEQQNLMRSIAEDIVSNPLVKQPYVLRYCSGGLGRLRDVRDIFSIVLADRCVRERSLEKELRKLFVEAYIAFHKAREDKEHVTADVRDVIHEVHAIASKFGDVRANTRMYLASLSIYVARQRARDIPRKKKIYAKIADYLAEVVSALVQRRIGVEEALPPFYDMYLVTKLLMGGAK